jgi:hypothetical protein
MKEGNKSDKIDARKLADLLRGGYLRSVYHGENGLRTLKELARSYLTISKDLTRVMNRVKALYRSWGILCGGQPAHNSFHEVWFYAESTPTRLSMRLLYRARTRSTLRLDG